MSRVDLRIVSTGLLAAALVLPASAKAEPSIAELYDMIQAQQARIEKLEGQQESLRQEAATARAEAAGAQASATVARQKLDRAEAEIASVRADVIALPDVAAAADAPAAQPGLFASFDALYWTFDGGKAYDYVGIRNLGNPSSDLIGGVETVEHEDSWAFRGEAGYRFGSGIDVAVRALHFDTYAADETLSATFDLVPLANFGEEDDVSSSASQAEVRLGVKFRQVDLEAGKWISIGGGVDLRPFGAVRWSDLNQDVHLLYQDSNDVDRIEAYTAWWGVGVLGGVEGRWSPIERVSLFGRGAAGILGGEYRSEGTLFDDDAGVVEMHGDEEGDTFVPVLEASVGLGVRLLETDLLSIDIEAGYEALSFIDAPAVFRGAPDDERNPAHFDEETQTFHGAFLRLGVGF